jgi:hypothetical protein
MRSQETAACPRYLLEKEACEMSVDFHISIPEARAYITNRESQETYARHDRNPAPFKIQTEIPNATNYRVQHSQSQKRKTKDHSHERSSQAVKPSYAKITTQEATTIQATHQIPSKSRTTFSQPRSQQYTTQPHNI